MVRGDLSVGWHVARWNGDQPEVRQPAQVDRDRCCDVGNRPRCCCWACPAPQTWVASTWRGHQRRSTLLVQAQEQRRACGTRNFAAAGRGPSEVRWCPARCIRRCAPNPSFVSRSWRACQRCAGRVVTCSARHAGSRTDGEIKPCPASTSSRHQRPRPRHQRPLGLPCDAASLQWCCRCPQTPTGGCDRPAARCRMGVAKLPKVPAADEEIRRVVTVFRELRGAQRRMASQSEGTQRIVVTAEAISVVCNGLAWPPASATAS